MLPLYTFLDIVLHLKDFSEFHFRTISSLKVIIITLLMAAHFKTLNQSMIFFIALCTYLASHMS